MRLISQDGTKDYSYETTSVSIETIMERVVADMGQTGNYENKVHHYEIVCTDSYGIMGKYSTKEKALKVMEMLQQAYIGRNEAFNLDMADGAEEELLNIIKRQGFGTLHVFEKDRDPRVDFFPLHTYFKFPDDEEVET